MTRRSPLALCLAAVLAGCAVGPTYTRPDLALPAAYTATPPASAASSPQLITGVDVPAAWWRAFGSPALTELVGASLQRNPDIAAAEAALRVAQENVRVQRAGWVPTVGIGYQPVRERVADAVASPVANNSTYYTLHTAQVSVSYVPDVFGGLRRQIESASAQAEVQRCQLAAAQLALSANVVVTAVNEASLRAQRRALQAIVQTQRALLGKTERLALIGQTGPADIAVQAAALAATEAALPAVEKQLAAARNLLATLAGRYPSDGIDATFELDAFHLPATLPLSVPAHLVDARPDVRAAEAQLQSASAGIGVAVAARWPQVTLGVDAYGSSAYRLSDLFKAPTMFWTLTGSITQTLIDGGALEHREGAARAAFDQAAAQYRSTVQSAFQDVANALQAIEVDVEVLRIATAAERTADDALQRTRRQNALGDTSADAVLAALQVHEQMRLNLAVAEAARDADAAALFQALGGGFGTTPGTSADGATAPGMP